MAYYFPIIFELLDGFSARRNSPVRAEMVSAASAAVKSIPVAGLFRLAFGQNSCKGSLEFVGGKGLLEKTIGPATGKVHSAWV